MLGKSDEQIIQEYLGGDEKQLEVLIKRYLKPIYAFIFRNIGNPEEAEDITQEVFVKVWKNLKKFDLNRQKKNSALYRSEASGAGFKTWIFTIAKNSSIDFLRRKKTIPFPLNEEFLASKSNFIEGIEQKNAIKKIHNALQEFSPNYRALILLKNESNLTFREIANDLNEPLNTIKSRYRRALIALKQIVS